MSFEPPVTSKVQTIRNKFENLRQLESLDIIGPSIKKNPQTFFRRSATTFAVIHSDAAREIVKKYTQHRKENNPINRQSSDGVLTKNKSLNTRKPNESVSKLKEIPEAKLVRHTSDPNKRSSIKRSPAFRVGEKQNKTMLVKSSDILPKEFEDDKFNEMLEKCVNDTQKLQEASLTNTLKAVLKQPLPTGPPPKKPPRLFESPIKDLKIGKEFEERQKEEEREIKTKINFLEHNLILKQSQQGKHKKHQQENNTIQPNNSHNLLISCLPCGAQNTIYDTVTPIPMYETDSIKTNNLILYDEVADDNYEPITKRFPDSNNPEHIYMEPFGHLKANFNANTMNKIQEITNIVPENINNERRCSMGNNCVASEGNSASKSCLCPEKHSSNLDLHYLCANVSDRMIVEHDCTSLESDGQISLGNTYDEINLLVNAAFNEKIRENNSNQMGAAATINDHHMSTLSSSTSSSTVQKQIVRPTRSVTEKRKDYVRRISAAGNSNKSPSIYGILKTFSAFENNDEHGSDGCVIASTSERINQYKKLIETSNEAIIIKRKTKLENAEVPLKQKESHPFGYQITNNCSNNSAVDQLFAPTSNSTKLFQMCLLIGFNISTNVPYVKSKFPPNVVPPQNIEQLVFPVKNLLYQNKSNQDYSLVLTDDKGCQIFGYCRRVLPESSEICLPLAYCLVSTIKAPGFYFKVLKEIESRHGETDFQTNFLLKNIQQRSIPEPGKFLHLKLPLSPRSRPVIKSNYKVSQKRMSLEANPKWLTDAFHDMIEHEKQNNNNNNEDHKKKNLNGNSGHHRNKSLVQEFEERKKESEKPPFDLSLINKSLSPDSSRGDEIFIRRPNDLRLESTELSDLFESLGANLLLHVFGTLLIERKVILFSTNISLVSSCVLGLQTILYPFQWQYTVVTALPENLMEICQAPFPVLAGTLLQITADIEDGIIVNLDTKTMLQKCGDESTLLPINLRNSLMTSLNMINLIDQGRMLSSVLIAEAFVRFFVELFSHYKEKMIDKELFVQSHPCQSVRLFLEWFVETAMFAHYLKTRNQQKKEVLNTIDKDTDRQLDNFYALFHAKLLENSENNNKTGQNIDTIIKNCKIINKKAKSFKDRFKDFLNSN